MENAEETMEDQPLKTFKILRRGQVIRAQARTAVEAAEVYARGNWLEGHAMGEVSIAQSVTGERFPVCLLEVREDAHRAESQYFGVSVVNVAAGRFVVAAIPVVVSGTVQEKPEALGPTYVIKYRDRSYTGHLCDGEAPLQDTQIVRQLGLVIAQHAMDLWVELGGGEFPERQIWTAQVDGETGRRVYAVFGDYSIEDSYAFWAKPVGLKARAGNSGRD